MKCKELYPAGSFKHWDAELLLCLQQNNITTNVGQTLMFENDLLKVWKINLLPNESLPFHKHTTNYNWTVLTNGSATSHYETGRIVSLEYLKGDLSFYDHDKKGDFVHNLKNTGENILEFVTVEYKSSQHKIT